MFNWCSKWKEKYDQCEKLNYHYTKRIDLLVDTIDKLKAKNKPRKKRAKEIAKRGNYHFVSQDEIVAMKAMFLNGDSINKTAVALDRSPSTISKYLHKMYDAGELEK